MNKHIIYLAAGSGSRFGSNKLLCPLEGKPLFRHGLDTLAGLVRARKDCDLTIVSRYGPVLEAAQAAGGPGGGQPGQRPGPVLHHPGGALRPEPHFSGGFSPVRGSRPAPPGERDGGPAAGRRPTGGPHSGGLLGGSAGQPVLFSAALLPELEALTGDQGGRVVLRRHWDRCILLPAEDPLELADADTPEALLALRQGESDTLKSY